MSLRSYSKVYRVGGLLLLGAATAGAQETAYLVGSGGLEDFSAKIDTTAVPDCLAGDIALTHVSGPGGTFSSVCTDVSGTLYLGGTYTYDPPTAFGTHSGLDPTWGAGNAPGHTYNANDASVAIQAAADIYFKNSWILTSGTTDQKAGLQLAVWTALYNTSSTGGAGGTPTIGSFTLSSSRFQVLGLGTQTWSGSWGTTSDGTAAAEAEANALLSQVNFSDQYIGNLVIPDPQSQNGGYGVPAITAQEVLENVTPVPEATTMIAGGLLLIPFAASTLRFRRKAS